MPPAARDSRGNMGATNASDAEAFITHWTGVSGSERANYPVFVVEGCELPVAEPPSSSSDGARR